METNKIQPQTKIIAEVASNHGGDINVAKEFVKVAADLGIDYIKFQSWQARTLKADDPQYEWLNKAELSDEAHYELINECNKFGIEFLTTCFNIERIDFLSTLGLKTIKVGSADCASYRMIKELKDKFEHLIISTGMHLPEEIAETANILEGNPFTLLHCVSLYPTPIEKVNLTRIQWLKQFTPDVGYSDHCIGVEAAKVAIALGATYIEKHFTLGEGRSPRSMPWDASPEEMDDLLRFRDNCNIMLSNQDNMLNKEEMEARHKFIGRFGDNK